MVDPGRVLEAGPGPGLYYIDLRIKDPILLFYIYKKVPGYMLYIYLRVKWQMKRISNAV